MRRAGSVVATLLVAGLGAAGCGHHSAAEDDAAHPARARVVATPLALHTFDRVAEGTGQWRSATETPVQAPFDAIVEALAPHPGERVERGATIGRWTTYESEAALQGAQLWREGAADSATAREGERALAQARRSLVHVPITAPVTGTVVRRSAEPGARLAAGTEVLAIVPDDEVVFEAHLRADDARVVKIGMPATIGDGDGLAIPARVLTLLPAAGGDQTVLAWLRPLARRERPDLGRFGTARIRLGDRVTALAAPDSAIVEDDLTGAHRIATVDSAGRVQWVAVKLGPRDGTLRGVEGSRLAAGTRVIVQGQRALADGAEVSPGP